VRLTPRLTALCPVAHWADVAPTSAMARKKAGARFRVGQRMPFRVLEVKLDAQPRRVLLTAKKTLLASDLPRIASYAAAAVGTVTHGTVTGFQEFGVFVGLYGGVQALLRYSTAPLCL
jgi:rRNA biogenesis protein RRP5